MKLKSACREPDLSLEGVDPVSLSKIETHLLASLGSTGKKRKSLACLRNACFHFAESYCTPTCGQEKVGIAEIIDLQHKRRAKSQQ